MQWPDAPADDEIPLDCPGYWNPMLRKAKYKNLFVSHDYPTAGALLREIMLTVHERSCQDLRRSAPQPEAIQHMEGALCAECKLHMDIVASYEWHVAAAQMEQKSMRSLVQNPPPNSCYLHAGFCEKLPVPLSGSETSGMFHGAARKTLSIFGCYCVHTNASGEADVLAIILVSEVIQLSALFGALRLQKALEKVNSQQCWHPGRAHSRIRQWNPLPQRQRTRLNYLVEKHGKSMAAADAEIFAAIRRWLDMSGFVIPTLSQTMSTRWSKSSRPLLLESHVQTLPAFGST